MQPTQDICLELGYIDLFFTLLIKLLIFWIDVWNGWKLRKIYLIFPELKVMSSIVLFCLINSSKDIQFTIFKKKEA